MVTMHTQQVDRGGDGSMTLYTFVPERTPTAAILVIQEIFGVGPYIRAVCERLAAAGYLVGAPDVFWRFHPGWEAGHDPDGLTESIGKVQQLDVPAAVGDCIAALDQLSATPGIDRPAAVLGYCLGGTLAWAVAANGAPSACVSYYGSSVPSMIGMIDQVQCPTLFHFGNSDAYIPNEGVEAIAAAITGRDGFVLNVEHAGHAFDNHEAEMFWDEAAARSAWAKTMAFLGEQLPG